MACQSKLSTLVWRLLCISAVSILAASTEASASNSFAWGGGGGGGPPAKNKPCAYNAPRFPTLLSSNGDNDFAPFRVAGVAFVPLDGKYYFDDNGNVVKYAVNEKTGEVTYSYTDHNGKEHKYKDHGELAENMER